MLNRKSVLINGRPISYLEANPGKSRSLLYVHGISMNAALFERVMQDPAMADFHAVAFDLPGHGENIHSKNPEEDYTLGALEILLSNIVAALNLSHLTIIGHSMGGHVAIHVLRALRAETEGIILVGTPPLSSLKDAALAFLPIPEMQLVYLPYPDSSQRLQLAKVFGNDKHLEEIQAAMIKSDPAFRKVFVNVFSSDNFPDEVGILNSFPGNIMIFHGAEDKMINLDYIQNLKIKNLFNGTATICPNGNHLSFLDNPHFFINSIRNFMLAESLELSS